MRNPLVRVRKLLRSRLFARALVVNLTAVSAMVLLLATVFLWIERNEFRIQMQARAGALADFAAMESQFAMLVGDDSALEHLANSVLANEDVLFVVLAPSDHPQVVAGRPGIPRAEIIAGAVKRIRTASGQVNVIDVRRTVRAPEHGLADWVAGSSRAGALGNVRLGFSMAKQDRLFARTVASVAAIAVVALMLIWALQYIQLRRLLQPITTLGDFARRVGEGDLARRAPVSGEDEVASVARALNQMVERLGATMVSKSYVDNIIQSMGESLIVVDAGGSIQTANHATCALLGYTEEELVGRAAAEIVGADGRERTYRTRRGSRIPVLFSEAQLDGAGAARVLVAQDITEQKRVEQQLIQARDAAEEASRAKSLFLANMSHELRTPLNAIIGYAELIEEVSTGEDDKQTLDDVGKIRSAGLHLRDLINDVLDISKMEAGKIEASATCFDLGGVLQDVVNTVRPLAAQNGNAIDMSLHWEAGPVHTDQIKFRQSLLNLMSNACKFTRGGRVALDIESERRNGQDWIRAAVRDTGLGIPPEKLGKLFQAFYQVDTSLTRKHGGTGLGLAITRNLCEMLGGNVEVASTLGQGSVFTIHLPATLPAAAGCGDPPRDGN